MSASILVQLRTLVEEHARAWQRVGNSDLALCFDPFRSEIIKHARAKSAELLAFFAKERLP